MGMKKASRFPALGPRALRGDAPLGEFSPVFRMRKIIGLSNTAELDCASTENCV
jgi:hypothetical protein